MRKVLNVLLIATLLLNQSLSIKIKQSVALENTLDASDEPQLNLEVPEDTFDDSFNTDLDTSANVDSINDINSALFAAYNIGVDVAAKEDLDKLETLKDECNDGEDEEVKVVIDAVAEHIQEQGAIAEVAVETLSNLSDKDFVASVNTAVETSQTEAAEVQTAVVADAAVDVVDEIKQEAQTNPEQAVEDAFRAGFLADVAVNVDANTAANVSDEEVEQVVDQAVEEVATAAVEDKDSVAAEVTAEIIAEAETNPEKAVEDAFNAGVVASEVSELPEKQQEQLTTEDVVSAVDEVRDNMEEVVAAKQEEESSTDNESSQDSEAAHSEELQEKAEVVAEVADVVAITDAAVQATEELKEEVKVNPEQAIEDAFVAGVVADQSVNVDDETVSDEDVEQAADEVVSEVATAAVEDKDSVAAEVTAEIIAEAETNPEKAVEDAFNAGVVASEVSELPEKQQEQLTTEDVVSAVDEVRENVEGTVEAAQDSGVSLEDVAQVAAITDAAVETAVETKEEVKTNPEQAIEDAFTAGFLADQTTQVDADTGATVSQEDAEQTLNQVIQGAKRGGNSVAAEVTAEIIAEAETNPEKAVEDAFNAGVVASEVSELPEKQQEQLTTEDVVSAVDEIRENIVGGIEVSNEIQAAVEEDQAPESPIFNDDARTDENAVYIVADAAVDVVDEIKQEAQTNPEQAVEDAFRAGFLADVAVNVDANTAANVSDEEVEQVVDQAVEEVATAAVEDKDSVAAEVTAEIIAEAETNPEKAVEDAFNAGVVASEVSELPEKQQEQLTTEDVVSAVDEVRDNMEEVVAAHEDETEDNDNEDIGIAIDTATAQEVEQVKEVIADHAEIAGSVAVDSAQETEVAADAATNDAAHVADLVEQASATGIDVSAEVEQTVEHAKESAVVAEQAATNSRFCAKKARRNAILAAYAQASNEVDVSA